MRVTDAHRKQTEERIRAASDRLLRGDIPPGCGCDVKTLAVEAGVTRAALYPTSDWLRGRRGIRCQCVRPSRMCG